MDYAEIADYWASTWQGKQYNSCPLIRYEIRAARNYRTLDQTELKKTRGLLKKALPDRLRKRRGSLVSAPFLHDLVANWLDVPKSSELIYSIRRVMSTKLGSRLVSHSGWTYYRDVALRLNVKNP